MELCRRDEIKEVKFWGLIATIVILFEIGFMLTIPKPVNVRFTQLHYCQELSDIYFNLQLQTIRCTHICKSSDVSNPSSADVICFDFAVTSEGNILNDIAAIRTVTLDYLETHPDSELNHEKIAFRIRTQKDSEYHYVMASYDMRTGEIPENAFEYWSISELLLYSSENLALFPGVNGIYECYFDTLKDFKASDLQYLDYFYGFTEEGKEAGAEYQRKIQEQLPNCDVHIDSAVR